MTCRHAEGDPDCSSTPSYVREARNEAVRKALEYGHAPLISDPASPDSDNFEIEEIEVVGAHVVLKVRYPNCAKCAYEGSKVMVFFGTDMKDVVKWRRIDPHFRPPSKSRKRSEAPSPDARFPASKEGWKDAIAFARYKTVR